MTEVSSNADRWRRVEAIFHDVVELAPNKRTAFLTAACADDPALRRDVERLLRHDDGDDAELLNAVEWQPMVTQVRRTVLRDSDPLAKPGTIIDKYRLIEQIASGGMGVVWRAERVDGAYKQHVAIKLIKRGMDTDDILRRFRNERQLLAQFEHTNIARLLDGGATADGRPYLVMEFIDGVPIDQYCSEKTLSIPDRLKLFLRVCTAIHEAHKNLIVHRDLKPSNMLVSADGEPKLLDFGIAKMLDPVGRAQASITATDLRMLTPRYASPEQIEGRAITTASDVYSLGVILYELLTGCCPYNVNTESRHELERMVVTHEPTRPSIVVTCSKTAGEQSQSRTRFAIPETNTRRLGRLLAGDLDTIVMTALRKEPTRRYGSAMELASDIKRYLRDEPITARPDTWRYRAGKFVRRNRTGVIAATTLAVVIVSALFVSLSLFARAERARGVADERRDEAEWALYLAGIAAADGSLGETYLPRKALGHLESTPERFRDWEYDYLLSQIDRSLVDMVPEPQGERKICVAWQPGGTLLALGEGHATCTLRIFDGRTGEQIAEHKRAHSVRADSMSFSPDGSRLGLMSLRGEFALWNVREHDVQLGFRHRFEFPTTHFEFVGSRNRIAVPGRDGKVRGYRIDENALTPLWVLDCECDGEPVISRHNLTNLLAISTPTRLMVVDGEVGAVRQSVESDQFAQPLRVVDDRFITGVANDNDLMRWNIDTLEVESRRTVRSTKQLYYPYFHPDPQFIAFKPQRGHHFVMENPDEVRFDRAYHGFREYGGVKDLAFSDDGERVAVVYWERMLETWDVSGTPSMRELKWDNDTPDSVEHFTTVDCTSDGLLLATGSAMGAAIWEPRTGIRIREFIESQQGAVACVRFHPDGARLATSGGGVVIVWDLRTGQQLWTPQLEASTKPECMATSPDGTVLAVIEAKPSSDDVQLLDWTTGDIVRTLEAPDGFGAWAIEFSADGKYLACGTSGGRTHESRVCVWNVSTGELVHELFGFERIIETVAWSPDSKLIAVGGQRHNVFVWNVEDGELIATPRMSEGAYRTWDLLFTRTGTRLIAGNSSAELSLWDVAHQEEVHRIGPVSGPLALAMPADQRFLVCAARWTVRIWDTASPAERVAAEVVRRRYDETPGDWSTITERVENDRWLLDMQKAEALELIAFLRQYAPSYSSDAIKTASVRR